MAGIKRSQGGEPNTNTINYDLETEADLQLLPTYDNGVRVAGKADWCKNDLPPIGSGAWVIGSQDYSWSYYELTYNGWRKIVGSGNE